MSVHSLASKLNSVQIEVKSNVSKNNPARTGTVTGITKAMVGFGNVQNTSDADKPVSSAVAGQLATKAPLSSPAFTGTVTGITKAMVGLGNVANTSDADKPVSNAVANALATRSASQFIKANGTFDGNTYLTTSGTAADSSKAKRHNSRTSV